MNLLTEHQKKALNFKSHISLTANAGSGKTFVLANRYLEIALKENIPLRNIAAITFTDKAAGELYKKIAGEIERKLSGNSNGVEIKRLEEIRRQLVSANISTIHSFCINILKEYPIEAKLDANFIPVDERLSGELIELSIEELIKNALKDSEEEKKLKYLIRIFASKNLLSKQIITLIKRRKNVLTIEKEIYNRNEEEIAGFFFNSFEEYLEKIFGGQIDSAVLAIKKINQTVLDSNSKNEFALSTNNLLTELLVAGKLMDRLFVLMKIKDQMTTKNGSIKKQGYLTAKLRENLAGHIQCLESLFDDIKIILAIENHNDVEIELAHFGKVILHFFNKALEIYSNRKKENGFLDYEDILLFTQDILKINSVRKSLSDKFKYLLIDEYQDTNEIQYNIFLPILEDLQKGNLFVVGDEKQSIYMFRDAELEVFNRTKKNIQEIEGAASLLTLPDSFRMAPELCLFANSLFRNLFDNPNELFNEVEHSDLVCALNDDIKGRVEILISKTNSDANQDENTESLSEAEIVAQRILQLISDNNEQPKIRWKDIAILCRKRKSFVELEKVFIKLGIPFLIIGGKDFYQRQTIYDIYNYFVFLLDEGNDTALTGILRSPFFSISDSEIFEVSLQKGEILWVKLRNYVSVNSRLSEILLPLIEIKNKSGNSDFVFLLRKILNESNFLSVIASRPDGVQELANIQKLIQLTINFSSQGFRTLYDYVNYLKESIEQLHEEAQASVVDDSNAVKIMTLHQAKGLEFPAVFLFNSGDNTQAEVTKSKSITISKDFGLLAKLPLHGNYFEDYIAAPVIGVNDYIINKKNLAEVKRLFYVGVTRAKYILIISAVANKDMKFNKDSFMQLLLQGMSIDLNEENYVLESELTYLKSDGDRFINITKPLSLNIPVRTKIDIHSPKNISGETGFTSKNLLTGIVKDKPAGEIISATKYSIYSQCPMKYKLTYDFGLSNIIEKVYYNKIEKKENHFEFESNMKNDEEDGQESNNHLSKIKGSMIHLILEKELSLSILETQLDGLIEDKIKSSKLIEFQTSAFKQDVLELVKKYYESDSYKQIKSFPNYKNEFEVFVKEKENFLYGIIDRIIFDKEKIIIVDYKTDDISENDIKEKSEVYINQMNFYSYIVSKLFPNVTKFELRLIFLKHPQSLVAKEITSYSLKEIKDKINLMTENILRQSFVKNANHCPKCKFSINFTRCIKN
ncbi:MAG: UvrD-helicase domain-containing protein [Ignavibacteriaceae bacterium]